MGEAAVAFLLEQVKAVVVGYADLISGAENELEQLKTDLALLKGFLKQTAEKKKKEAPLMSLEKETRDAVYVVEDTIDTGLTQAIAKKSKSIHRLSLKNVNLAKEVKSIREAKVKPLLDKFAAFDFKSGAVEDPLTDSKGDTPIRQNKVVGFDEEEAIISGYLKTKTEKLDVISIVGIPGQGKATLAWKIYQSHEIRCHFPIRIWVNISQVFKSRDVFLEILKRFFPNQDMSSLNFFELVQTVCTCLKKEKFLLVLTDMWSVTAWDEIKEVLPIENGEAKVLITTRDTDVAVESRVYRAPHFLKFLDVNESWELLKYEVFGLEDCPPQLSNIGYLIAKKCDGLPLAIVVIGGILFDQLTKSRSTTVSEWETLSTNVSGALQAGKNELLTEVLELSYQRLPNDLRTCFVYLGVFPEDYEIPAKMLCGLWISEGFVLARNGRSLEESAEDNMYSLICRNLLKVEKTNHIGEVKTCRIHYMIRAFCIKISKDENLWHEIKLSRTGALQPPVSEIKDSHRLSFCSNLSKFLMENPYGPHVRSFLCFYERPVEVNPEYISVIPNGFKKLRILESKCIIFHQFPPRITKLIHLRYLTLYIERLETLPEPITQLWNLQSLVVETKSRSITMKANMWKMVRLRYLKTGAAIVLDDSKWKGDAGQNLHTLNRLAPESCTEAVSKKAKNLKTLGISGKVANVFGNKFLENLHHLEKLKLVNSVTYEQTSEDKLHSLPPQNHFPPYLKRLTLTNTFLGWQHMSILAMIKSLEALKLKDNAFVGLTWNLGRDSFPNLQLLLICNTNLLVWEASIDSFPKLRFLVVKHCENLKEIPECLGTHLEKLEIDRVCLSAVQSAKKIEEANKGKPKGKFEVPFNLIVGAACDTK
ncbi:putative late blight resistance protein homolog R1A-10 [Salvia miltiorrhiza]|uniref:putative late blight resistance protein homolog R1A-10 n=1 Tax=Salvia miltiorrhiza TaxID=226208 RepID=UPI0025AC5B8A|nr:putative late blight resistance protein homolog R1A-10 [Salvia miltiorrhiza]